MLSRIRPQRLPCLARGYSKSPFLNTVSPDHINTVEGENDASHQISVLMDELTSERLLVKKLRDESETLRSQIRIVEEREQELAQLSEQVETQKRDTESYKRKLLETENKLNDVRIQYKDFKDAMEVETVRLNQSRSLPIILAGIAGVAGIAYL
jgi:septal ring factor EnvC (AmiA/AmiB activator)